jgi:CheY-like chemotaxis protein
MAKILVVEDEIKLRSALCEKLSKSGFDVLSAKNGQEALDQVIENPDLILLDLLMPVMDGQVFCNKLKTLLKKDIPIIILTNVYETAHPSDIKEVLNKAESSLVEIVAKVKKYLPE